MNSRRRRSRKKKEELKKWKKNLIKETTVERDQVFHNTEEAEKDQKRKRNVQHFLKKEKRSFQKEQNYVLSECKDYWKKKNFQKRIVKRKKVFKDMERYGEKRREG